MKSLKEIFSKIISSKKNLIIIGVIAILMIGGIILIVINRNSFKCKPTGPLTEKTYKTKFLAVDEWRKYNDPEVKFFFEDKTQKILSEKINSLNGYNNLSYEITDNSLSVDRDNLGKKCPLRYKYEIAVNASISARDLPSTPFGRWYYKDRYKITAVYNPRAEKWEVFDINPVELKLIPAADMSTALMNAQKGYNFQEIKKQGFEISEVYWEQKNDNIKNDVVVLVYSKSVTGEENCSDYYTIKIDNFDNIVISENQEKKCQ